MKKVISAVLAVVMLGVSTMMFSSCGFSASPESKGSTAGAKELHMATNAAFEPYEYVEGGQVVGIDAEIARVLCDKLGYTLVIDDMDFDAIIPAVASPLLTTSRARRSAYSSAPPATSLFPTSTTSRWSVSARAPTRFWR